MNVETVPIDSVSPDPANVRLHPERNLESIKASLRRFGQQKPIVVDENAVVRAGNGTLAAAQALGWSEIAIVRTTLDSVEATAFAIADNRTSELAEWDYVELARIMQSLEEQEGAAADLGWSEAEMRAMMEAHTDIDPESPEGQSLVNEKLRGMIFQVIIDCKDETQQAEVVQLVEREGYTCRVSMS